MGFQTQPQMCSSKYVQPCFVFKVTFLFGLCAHAYRFFNLDFSHDSLLIYEGQETLYQIVLGRFAQPLYWAMRGDLTAPFLLGLLSLIWLALANYIVISLLGIRSFKNTALLCGILSTNAVLAFAYATYLPWTDVYMLAYFLAALAVWLTVRFSYGFLAAWLPVTLSLGLYQSYINVAVILFMLVFIKQVLDGSGTRELLLRAAKYVVALLGGLMLYYIVLQAALAAVGLGLFEGYNGLSQVGNFSGSSVLDLIIETVKYPIRYMLHPETHLPFAAALINIAIFLLSASALVRITVARKLIGVPLLLLILCILAMPFGINVVYFISKGVQHSLMMFSYFFFYVFAVMLWEYGRSLPLVNPSFSKRVSELMRRARKVLPAFCGGLLGVLIFLNIVFANQVYLKKGLEYEASISFVTKVTYTMEQTEGYIPGETPVLFLGSPDESPLTAGRNGFEHLNGVGLDSQYSPTYTESWPRFFNAVLSYNINWMYTNDGKEYAALPEVQDMPVYPAGGSCQIVDGVLIIRLS